MCVCVFINIYDCIHICQYYVYILFLYIFLCPGIYIYIYLYIHIFLRNSFKHGLSVH